MSATSTQVPVAESGAARRGHHPGLALAIIAGSQLMVVLDATIVNIALPHIQTALNFSTTNLTWVLNAYTLTFGGLLLLGGRAGDILGRRSTFIFGLGLFTFASFLGGLATASWWLLAARALQGVGGAIVAPTALSLITTNFEEGAERNRAFGVFAAVSGSGAAIGLLAGGMLTSWLSWRWVLFVNIPIGIAIGVLAPLYINESQRHPGRFDVAGAVTSTLGMTALVYGFIRAASDGWRDDVAVTSFAAALVLLVLFLVIETRSLQPITPLHMFANRDRSASYVVMLALAGALFSMFFFLTLFVQNILSYSPLKAGFAFLPVSAGIIVSATFASKQLLKVGPKPFMVSGAILCVVGLFWLSLIKAGSGYIDGLLGPMVIFALGMGFLFVPLTVVAVAGVEPHESGSASGLLNVMQQVGGTIGLAILTTAFATASNHATTSQKPLFLASNPSAKAVADFNQKHLFPAGSSFADHVLAHGISTALQVSVIFGVITLIAAVVGIRAKASDVDTSSVPGMG
jgi:EmrB/QacA subfamily drug resistance transporter